MTTRIDTVAARQKLKPRRDPYYQRISIGAYVGFRKMVSGSAGTWSIRVRDQDTGVQTTRSLGTLSEHPDHARFDAASKEAKGLMDHSQAGGIVEAKTIADVCSSYVEHLRMKKGEKAAADAAKRFANYVLDDPKFAAIELSKLKPVHVGDWRLRLAKKPITRGSGHNKTGGKVTSSKRTASSLNRDMTPFRAALNHAHSEAWVTTDFAWRSKLKPIEGADQQRQGGYLTREQRMALIDSAAATGTGVDTLVRVLCGLPIRPGALALLRVKNYNSRLNELSIKLDKTGERKIVLPANMATIFAEACKSKLPDAFIFARPDGSPWNKDAWKHPIKRAVLAAGLSDKTVMYSLRHAVLTDMVANGIDLLTISRLSGTSIAMIQKHYGHLIPAVATAAIASVAI